MINQKLENKIYDFIFLNFSIHYAFNNYGFDNLMNEINKRSLEMKNTTNGKYIR